MGTSWERSSGCLLASVIWEVCWEEYQGARNAAEKNVKAKRWNLSAFWPY